MKYVIASVPATPDVLMSSVQTHSNRTTSRQKLASVLESSYAMAADKRRAITPSNSSLLFFDESLNLFCKVQENTGRTLRYGLGGPRKGKKPQTTSYKANKQ